MIPLMDWNLWQQRFINFLQTQANGDAAHDLAHVRRVVQNSLHLAKTEAAPLEIVLPAAWLHDCVVVPKGSPQRAKASRLAAETAVAFLDANDYPQEHLDAIAHAIAAHSFSAKISPQTLAARVVQDADRLDALGAIGIARTFIVGGALGRPLYHEEDPFCRQRTPDDHLATLDHFYTKLLRLPQTMQTATGRREAAQRVAFMQQYLDQLAKELPPA